MLLSRPLSALTKVPIDVWAPAVSLPMVRVVGVYTGSAGGVAALAALALRRLSVTPLITEVTWLLALLAA